MDSVQLHQWSEALAGIARTGLAFTENLYEQERFNEVLKVAAEMQSTASGKSIPVDEVIDAWVASSSEGVSGYVTPKIAVGAAVHNDHGQILLIQRADNGHWLYPTGWADIGYSAAEVVLKEVQEETGITAEILRPIAIFDSYQLGAHIPFYTMVFMCRAVGGELRPHPLETKDVGWFDKDSLPRPLAGHTRWVDIVFRALTDPQAPVYFDPPRREKLST